jgi:hypothetical protein
MEKSSAFFIIYKTFLLTKYDDLLNSKRPRVSNLRGKDVDNFINFFPHPLP